MKILEDPWLAAIMGHGVFKIGLDAADGTPGDDGAGWYEPLIWHQRLRTRGTYYAKIDPTRINIVRQLGSLGFYVVDVNVTFGLDREKMLCPIQPKPGAGCRIGEVAAHLEDEVLAIARSCFRFSRFHQDPQIPNTIADQIKHDWILNYLRKQRGEQLWVATVDGRAAGFLAVIAGEAAGRRYRAIDLIGVAPAYQGRGIGQELAAFFIDTYRDQCDYLLVGTQIANLPSMRLYAKCGFALAQSAYVMHFHLVQPETR